MITVEDLFYGVKEMKGIGRRTSERTEHHEDVSVSSIAL